MEVSGSTLAQAAEVADRSIQKMADRLGVSYADEKLTAFLELETAIRAV